MNHIEQLKALLDFGESEKIFGISLPPDHQCQQIDKTIQISRDCEKYAASISKEIDIVQAQSMANDIEWNISEIPCRMEELRKNIESLRTWGEEWKQVAKSMVNYCPGYSDHVIPNNIKQKIESLQNEN